MAFPSPPSFRTLGRRLLELCECFVPEIEKRRLQEEQERQQQKSNSRGLSKQGSVVKGIRKGKG